MVLIPDLALIRQAKNPSANYLAANPIVKGAPASTIPVPARTVLDKVALVKDALGSIFIILFTYLHPHFLFMT